MTEEHKLYADQMELWFAEHERILHQLERAVDHYVELAELNRQQLELHRKRLELAAEEYNIWAEEHEAPKHSLPARHDRFAPTTKYPYLISASSKIVAAQIARERKLHPNDWRFIPEGRGRMMLDGLRTLPDRLIGSFTNEERSVLTAFE